MAHIRLEDLWYGYTADRPVLRGIDLTIGEGEFVALIGQNGAGKSTLAKHLNGIHRPLRGKVLLDSADIRERGLAALASQVGYCYQNPDHQIFHQTIYDEVAFGPRNLGLTPPDVEKRVREALDAVGLWSERQEPPYFAGKGERQRVAVASVLAMSPAVIVLDEPTTGLDWAGAQEMMALVRRLHAEGRTILMITHDMRLVADYAERVVVLGGGTVLLDGTPGEVFARPDVLGKTSLQAPQITRLAASLRPGAAPALSVAVLADLLEVTPEAAAGGTAPPATPAPSATSPAPASVPAGSTPLSTLHPSARLLATVALVLLPFLFQAPWILAVVLLAEVAAAYLLGLGRAGWRLWKALGLIGGAITFLTWLPFTSEGALLAGGVIPGLGWQVGVTDIGLAWAAGMGLRIASVSLASLAFVATTPPRQITAGLLGLGVPYPVAFLISLAFRLLPMSQRDAAVIREVQAVRGLDMEQGSVFARFGRFAAILGPLVLLALRRVQLIANALDSRGFRMRGGRHRLYRMPHWDGRAAGVALLAGAAVVLAIYLRILGFGLVLAGRL